MIADLQPQITRPPTSSYRFAEHLLDFYQNTGSGYDAWADGLNQKAAERLAAFMEPAAGEQALDIGCGTGLVSRHLGAGVASEGRVVGVDVSDHMPEIARGHPLGAATYLHMNAETLTFPDASFDMVTLGQCLPFLRNPEAALAQAHRVLKPGGRIGLCCRRRSLGTRAQSAFFASLDRLARRHPMRVPRPPEDRAVFGEPRVLLTMLREAGFTGFRRSQTIVGGTATDARAWVDLMVGAGPFPHALVSVLGPGARTRFEVEVETMMSGLEDEAYRLHHPFTFALAQKPADDMRREGPRP